MSALRRTGAIPAERDRVPPANVVVGPDVAADAFDEDYFERAPLRSSRALTTSTYRNLLFSWLGRCWPELLNGTGRRALEIGCGYGYVTDLLARQGYDATGVDIAPHAIERASRECGGPSTHFAVWDAEQAAPFEGRFDLLVALEVIEHLDHPEEALSAWSELVVPGGAVVCTTPNRLGPASRYWRDPTHVNVRSAARWRETFERTGQFRAVTVESLQWVPAMWRLADEIRFFPLPLVGAQLRILAVRNEAST